MLAHLDMLQLLIRSNHYSVLLDTIYIINAAHFLSVNNVFHTVSYFDSCGTWDAHLLV